MHRILYIIFTVSTWDNIGICTYICDYLELMDNWHIQNHTDMHICICNHIHIISMQYIFMMTGENWWVGTDWIDHHCWDACLLVYSCPRKRSRFLDSKVDVAENGTKHLRFRFLLPRKAWFYLLRVVEYQSLDSFCKWILMNFVGL